MKDPYNELKDWSADSLEPLKEAESLDINSNWLSGLKLFKSIKVGVDRIELYIICFHGLLDNNKDTEIRPKEMQVH